MKTYISGKITGLEEKTISEKDFDRMFDFLKQSNEKWYSGTDKDKRDFIVHGDYKYYCEKTKN